NFVSVRIYTNGIGPTFYQTSDYMDRDDFDDYRLALEYDEEKQEFMMVPIPTPDDVSSDDDDYYWYVCQRLSSLEEFQRLLELIVDLENMLWDNDKCVFVIC
ncbi:hypothetical protein MKX03_035152, partial [Papaver bracteatum]